MIAAAADRVIPSENTRQPLSPSASVNLPDLRTTSFSASILFSVLLCGCTTNGQDVAGALALAPEASVTLPETMSMVPQFNDAGGGDALAAGATLSAATDPVAAESAPVLTEVSALREEAAPRTSIADLFGTSKTAGGSVDWLIQKYAALYDVPVELVRRVVKRESNFTPSAYNRGHWGLMQIKHATARGMGYNGPARGLLDAETNLKYAVKYLRGAYMVAGGNHAQADRLYQRGYYYDAKRKGLLDETGLGKDRQRRRRG